MNDPARQPCDIWSDAMTAAAAVAVDPTGLGGLSIRAPAGEVRAAFLAHARACLRAAGGDAPMQAPWLQVPADVSDHQLLGGLDLERTLADGRQVSTAGALARAEGGVLAIAMAERMTPGCAAIIALAMDKAAAAGFAVVAQDEGIAPDERPPATLLERLALHLDASGLTHREIAPQAPPEVAAARLRLAHVVTPDGAIEALCATSAALGIASDRAPLFALRLARALAALAGVRIVREEDVALAARLVLAPRATMAPAPPQEESPPEEAAPPPDADGRQESADPSEAKQLEDKLLEATAAAIPADLLQMIRDNARRSGRNAASGKAGDARKAELRGRPIGSRRGELRSRARLDLLDTLRTAAPWQKLRGREPGGPLKVRPADVRLRRYRDRMASTTIFVVDASGSAAMDRLGEAKGAVELLLADCYVRRDEVALIAFRGAGADILLPATRSLNRARRSLAALPGGGGTPLAAGLVAAERMADEVMRKGRTPTLVFITDGRANVCRDGLGGREKAQEEAQTMARVIRGQNRRAIIVDNAPRPEPKARALAEAMGAAYLPLPHASAAALSKAVRSGVAA